MRAGILAALVVLCILSVLGPLGTYVREQSNTADLQRQVEATTAENARLTGAVRRWEDPAFVAAQARDRLHYVLPGETGYVVLDLPAQSDPAEALAVAGVEQAEGTDQDAADGGAAAGAADAWFDRLWGSVEAAGRS